jgi:hypothetical protein
MNTIFRAIVGSQAYGTSLPTSDTDYKGIYAAPYSELVGFGYREQIEINKDETLYEIRRFLTLASSGNPTVLELLFSPDDCVTHSSSAYEILKEQRNLFITKACANSFAGYAIQQIKKARGLDKKMNWEKSRMERKDLLDFCYVFDAIERVTMPCKKFLDYWGLHQENVGLVRIDHMRDCYHLFYDYVSAVSDGGTRMEKLNYKGIAGPESNEVRLSSVPKHTSPVALLYFNKDGYSIHCKDYREYQQWLETRNTTRYVDTITHGQKIDGKNLMHCVRLLDMAEEIASGQGVNIRRPNREELLKIRRGEVKLDELLDTCESRVKRIDNLFKESTLPDSVDSRVINSLLLTIRASV